MISGHLLLYSEIINIWKYRNCSNYSDTLRKKVLTSIIIGMALQTLFSSYRNLKSLSKALEKMELCVYSRFNDQNLSEEKSTMIASAFSSDSTEGQIIFFSETVILKPSIKVYLRHRKEEWYW